MTKRKFPESLLEDLDKKIPDTNPYKSKVTKDDILNYVGTRMHGDKERNMSILVLFYDGWTLDMIAEKYDVTRERIRQIKGAEMRALIRNLYRAYSANPMFSYYHSDYKEDLGLTREIMLTTRSENAVYRHLRHRGSDQEICDLYNSGKLLKIRNLGIGCALEIAGELKRLGYDIDENLYLRKENK